MGRGGGALGGAKISQNIIAPPLSVIEIVKYCGVVGGGALGALKSYKNKGAPLSVIKIVKNFGVWGGGEGHWGGRQNPTKYNGAPSLCHEDSYVLWRRGKRGGGILGAPKSVKR